MGDMATGVIGSYRQQVDHQGEKRQIDQLDTPNQEETDLHILPIERDREHDCHH